MPKPGVHKDFHGAFSYGLIHLAETHGEEAVYAYLEQMAAAVFRPLIDAVRRDGLPALEAHWRRVMDLEEAQYEMWWEGDELVLDVRVCPALEHIRKAGYPESPLFCEHTCVVNRVICEQAGCTAETEYDQPGARCLQRFRGKEKAR